MRVRRRFLTLGAAVALVAVVGCAPPTGDEPTYQSKPQAPYSSDRYSSTRLILQRTDGGFEVVSSTPSLGGVTQPNVDEVLPEILDGKQRLYEYTVRGADGATVAQGVFVVPLVARATFREDDDPDRIHHVEIDDPHPMVRVAIPFVPGAATVEFRALLPNPDRPRAYQEWDQESAGSITIGPPPAEPPRREESP